MRGFGGGRTRGFMWILTFAALMGVIASPLILTAQTPEATPAAEGAAAAPAGEPAAAEAAETEAAPEQQSMLWWIIETSGWIGALLFAISIYFVAIVIQQFMELREQNICPPELIQQWESQLAAKDYQAIYQTAKEDGSELGQLVAAGIAALPHGLPTARESIDRLGEVITVEMEKKISMLAVIGSLGPMIGLLGTLKGMITSFSVIAMSDTQLKPSEVAGGISEALLITFEGVAISVPAIYFYAVFKNRVATLSLMAINQADDFVQKMYRGAQSKPAA